MKLAKLFSMLLCALLATTVAFPMKRQNSSMPPTKRQKIEEEPQPQPPVSLSCATTNTTNVVVAKWLKLEASDKKCIEISAAAAHVSSTIKNMLDDLPDEQPDLVPLPMVSHQVLQKIVPLLEQEAQLQAQNHGESIIINTLLNGIIADNDWANNQLCCDAILAANWLGCQHILKVLTLIFIRTVSTDFYVQAFIAPISSNNHFVITVTAEQLGAALDSIIDETIKKDVLKNFGRCAISLVEYSMRKNHDLCLVKKWAQNFTNPKLCSVINTIVKFPDCICYIVLLGKDSQQSFMAEIELLGKLDNVIFIIEKDMALMHQMTVAGAPNVRFLQSIDNAFLVCIPSKFFSDETFEKISAITALGLNPDQLKPWGFGYDTWLNYSREQRQQNVIDSLSNLFDKNSAIQKRVFIGGHGNGGNDVTARMVSLKISEFRELLNRLCVWGDRDCSVESLLLRSCFSGGYNSVRFFTDNSSQPKLLPFTVGILSSADMPETSFSNSRSKLLKAFAESANSDINTIFRDALGQEQLYAGSFPMVREANKQTFEPAALGERLITIDDRAKNVPIEYGEFSIENRSSSSCGGFVVKGMYPHLKDLFLPYTFAFDSLSQMVATFLSHIPGSSYCVISHVTIKDVNDVIKPLDTSFNIDLEYDPQMRKVVFVNQMNDVQHVVLDFNYSRVLRYDYKDFASLMNVYRLWYEAQPLPGVVPGYDRKKALEQFNTMFWGKRIPPKATLCTDMFEAFADGNCTKLQEAFARCKKEDTAALELFFVYAVSHGLPLPPDIESDDIDGMSIGRCSYVESLAIDKTVLELFAQNGFDLKKRYFASKKSLFHLAVLAGNRCAVEFLLKHNYATVDEKDIHEEDAIDYAIAASNSDVFKLLSQQGLSFELFEKVIDLQDWNNNAQPLLEKLLDEHHVTQNFLKSDNGFDVLCHAIRCKKVEAIKWLLKQGVPFVRSDGFTIFHFIGKNKYFDMSDEINAVIITMLLSEQGKKLINELDPQGRTALDYAVESAQFDYVELLSKHGAEVTEYIKNSLKFGEDGIVERLLEALLSNDKNDPLLQKLLQNRLKADVGFKILCSAVDRGNVKVIEWLLKQNVSVVRSDGFTIFHYVVGVFPPHIPECITALLSSPQGKAHVNDTCVIEGSALSAFELTILRHAINVSYIFLDHPEVQFQQRAMAMSIKDSEFYLLDKLLLRREARKYINAEDSNGETLLEISIQKGDPVFVNLLLDHGAKFSARKFKGLTPLQIFEKCFSGTDEARVKIKELLQKAKHSLL